MMTLKQLSPIETAIQAINNTLVNLPAIGEQVDYEALELAIFGLKPLSEKLVKVSVNTDMERLAGLIQYHVSEYLSAINGDDLDRIDDTSERMNTSIYAFQMTLLTFSMMTGE